MSRPTTNIPKGSQIRFYGPSGLYQANRGFLFGKTSAFEDVKAKGKRIFDNDLYDIFQMNTYSVLVDVLGDNDVYTVYVNDKARVDKYDKNTPTLWQCTCTWSDWAFNRIWYRGRMCSHAYCAYLLLREVKKMAKVANDEDSTQNDDFIPFPELDFGSASTEVLFNEVYDLVEEDYEAFYDFIVEGFSTHSVSEAITDTLADYGLEYEELEGIIKLCLMQVQENALSEENSYSEELKAQALQEELEENGITMDDYDELLDSELFDEVEEEKVSRRTSSVKRAGRIFTEEEKFALIEEEGISWHVRNNMFH